MVEGTQRLPDHLARAEDDELPPIVEVRPDASRQSLVLEIRTSDRPGVIHLVLATLAELGLTVASAHVSTMGPQAVDVFYVQEVGGVRPTEERAADRGPRRTQRPGWVTARCRRRRGLRSAGRRLRFRGVPPFDPED